MQEDRNEKQQQTGVRAASCGRAPASMNSTLHEGASLLLSVIELKKTPLPHEARHLPLSRRHRVRSVDDTVDAHMLVVGEPRKELRKTSSKWEIMSSSTSRAHLWCNKKVL